MKKTPILFLALSLVVCQAILHAATTGSISGTVKDVSGGVIPGVALVVTNPATGVPNQTTTDSRGFYSFPSLQVGSYNLRADAQGFRQQDRKNLTIDADSALQIDLVLTVAEKTEELTVSESTSEVQLETVSTQMGDVVSSDK